MASQVGKRILVAIDESDRSVRTVQYIAENAFFRNMSINLFNVFTGAPEWYWDLTTESSALKASTNVLGWQNQKREEIRNHLEKCKNMLLAADFNPDQIETTIYECQHGVARDILDESRKGGYDAVVLRRRGTSNLDGLVMGSVALKLLGDIAPLIFAGQKPVNNRILVAVEGSERSNRAVDFVSKMLCGQNPKIKLVNVLRGRWGLDEKESQNILFTDYIKDTESAMKAVLKDSRDRLEKAGFDRNDLDTQIITGVESRAGAIANVAEKENFNTIVVGAKGLSRADEFIMGRVSSKLLYVGRQFHIWIVK